MRTRYLPLEGSLVLLSLALTHRLWIWIHFSKHSFFDYQKRLLLLKKPQKITEIQKMSCKVCAIRLVSYISGDTKAQVGPVGSPAE